MRSETDHWGRDQEVFCCLEIEAITPRKRHPSSETKEEATPGLGEAGTQTCLNGYESSEKQHPREECWDQSQPCLIVISEAREEEEEPPDQNLQVTIDILTPSIFIGRN